MIEGLLQTSYPGIGLSMYSGTLVNGQKVFLVPTPQFHEICGMMTVPFGAMDAHYIKDGVLVQEPLGLAHFLEHKLFEKEEVGDLLQLFAEYGAEANAFTSLTNTTYLFSAGGNWLENMQLLHQLVCQPYFTAESVLKERDIICQEIDLYLDDPDYVLYSALMAQLYPGSPLAYDIAGTVDSVNKITEASLHQAYVDFYNPSNRTLFLFGNFDVVEVWAYLQKHAVIDRCCKDVYSSCKVERSHFNKLDVIPVGETERDISIPKIGIGFRGNLGLQGLTPSRYRIALSLFFNMLLGWTSDAYQELYENGQVDGGLGIQVEVHDCFQYVLLTADASEPSALANSLQLLLSRESRDCTLEHFELLKREWYGDFLHQLDSVEDMAHQFLQCYLEGECLFDIPKLLEGLSFDTVMGIGREFLAHADKTEYQIFPKIPR